MQKQSDAENKSLATDPRVAALEAENARLRERLAAVASTHERLNLGIPVDPGDIVTVQFSRPYSFGGLRAGRSSGYLAAPFSVEAGDIVSMPATVADRIEADHDGLILRQKFQAKTVVARTFDKKRGEFVESEEKIDVSDLKKGAPIVALPRA